MAFAWPNDILNIYGSFSNYLEPAYLMVQLCLS